MTKDVAKTLRLVGALVCFTAGLLLWDNLAIHFSDIEDVLPYLRLGDLTEGKTVFFILIGAATVIAVFFAAAFPWRRLLHPLGAPFRAIATAAIFTLSFIPLFWLRFGGPAWLLIGFLGLGFFLNAVAVALTASWFTDAVKVPCWKAPGVFSRLHPWLPAVLAFTAALYFCRSSFGLIPHVEDSIAQLLQARIFASGRAAVEPFQPTEFFFYGFMVDMGKWYSQYPPGHPLALAAGVLLGAPFLVNPVIAFVSVVLFYFLLREIAGYRLAAWGSWAMILSPYFIFMHSGFMNHTTALAASLVGWLGLKKGESGRKVYLIIAGLGFGYCAATRPLEGVLFALVGWIYLLSCFGGVRLSSFLKTVPYALGFSAAAALYPLHNWLTTGNPLVTGYTLTWGGNGFGLGEVNWGPPHTLGYGLVNTFMSLSGMNVYLYEIPIPALLGVLFWAVFGRKMNRWDRAFLAAMILIPTAYLFYYFHDYCFGPRYYFVIVPMLIYFSILGVKAFHRRLVDSRLLKPDRARTWMYTSGIILLALQFLVAVPYRAAVYADGYWGVDDGPAREARRLNLSDAVVFIENHPWEILQTKLHSLGFIMGDAHRLLFTITAEGLDEILSDMGVDPDSVWTARLDPDEFERRARIWNEQYLKAGNPPIDPWSDEEMGTYYSNGAVHLDPRQRQPDVIFARDLGKHNSALMQRYPGRKAYRYAFDEEVGRFRILPLP